MTHRETLPQRRRAETFEFEAGVPGYGTARFVATVGFYNDGRVGEIFRPPVRRLHRRIEESHAAHQRWRAGRCGGQVARPVGEPDGAGRIVKPLACAPVPAEALDVAR